MELLGDIVSWICIGAGSVFILIGGVGLVRMPDFFTRLHPAGITDTLGTGLIVLGLIVQAGLTLVALKLLLLLGFLFITSPTTTHATAQAAIAAGLRPWRRQHRAAKDGAPSNS